MLCLSLTTTARAPLLGAQVQRYRAQMPPLATVAPSSTRLGFTTCSGKLGRTEPVICLCPSLQQQCCLQLPAGGSSIWSAVVRKPQPHHATSAHLVSSRLPAAASPRSGRSYVAAAAQQPAAAGEPHGSTAASSSTPASGGTGQRSIDWLDVVHKAALFACWVVVLGMIAVAYKAIGWIPMAGKYLWVGFAYAMLRALI